MPDDSVPNLRWWLFWPIEAVLLLAVFAVACYPYPEPRAFWPQAVLFGLMFVFCGSFAIALRGRWLPFSPSAESTALWEQVRARTPLGDDQFYEAYYQGSGIPKEIPTRLRAILHSDVGFPVEHLIPSDNLATLEEDIDFAELLLDVSEGFSIDIGPEDYPQFDGTLDNLVRQLHVRTKRTVAWDEFI